MSSVFRALSDPWMWVAAPPDDPLGARDPAFIAGELERLEPLFQRYHETHFEGLDRVPQGAALMVGNHNGGMMAPDMFATMIGWWRFRGVHEPAYGLMHDTVFRLPFLGRYLARLGAVPANPANAEVLLARDAKVLVYPGGDIDAGRPASRRNEIVFGERRGFIRVALRAGAPIVPVVSVGAHDGFHVLTDGREFVRRTGFKRLFRMEALPIAVGLPWGIFWGMMPYVPWPVRMKIRVLEPIAWPDLGPDAADDDEIVWRLREQVRQRMQAELDEMTAEGGFGRRWLW